MQLYTLENMPDFQILRTYRANTWVGMLLITAMMFALTIFVGIPKMGDFSPLVISVPGLLTLIFLGIFIGHLRLCFAPGNWLLKECPEGLFINLRSFRNSHLPKDARTILFLPADAVAGIGKTVEHRNLPFHWAREKSKFAHIDLYLREGVDTRPLREALHAERRCMNTSSWRHRYPDCPVQCLEPGVIRLVWEWIYPREDKAILLLGERFGVAPERTVKSPNWEKLSDGEKEALIDTLWERGYEERAYLLAAQHYEMREIKAKAIVHERNFLREWEE